MKMIWIALAIIATAWLCAACDAFAPGRARDNIQKTFKVAPGGKLSLNSSTGSIGVRAAGNDEVRVDVEREFRGASDAEAARDLQQQQIDFRQDGKDVYVEARRPGDPFSWGNRIRLRFTITVPERYDLDLKTGGGSITVNDIEGTISANTSGGSLNFGQVKGSVTAHTSGGSITLQGGSGPMEVNTSGGSIRIGKVYGPVRAHTSGGSLSVEEVQGQIQASTSGGSVHATITRQPEGDCELSTSGGSIHAQLSRDLNLNVAARTSGGGVRTNLPITVQGEVGRNRLEGKMNQGGPQLLLHTSGGSISINEAQ
jgi:hypothetical protein